MKLPHIAFWVTSLLTAPACGHVYYAPGAHNVPLFQEQNEARLMVAQSEGNYISGGEVQAAYAPFNRIGIIAGGYVTGLYVNGHGNYFEGGAGTFYTFANHIVLECYAVYGNGKAINEFENGGFIKHRFNKYYIQPSIGFTSKNIDFIASTRVAKLDFYDITRSGISVAAIQELSDDYNQLLGTTTSLFLEPGVTLRAGWKYFKIQFQFSKSSFMSPGRFRMDNSNINVALYLSLAKKNKPAFKKIFDFD